MIVDLEKRVAEQRAQIEKIEKKTEQLEKKFRILINELIHAGVVNVPERRKIILRSMFDQAALINLLRKKGVINKREFVREIKQLVHRDKATKKNG